MRQYEGSAIARARAVVPSRALKTPYTETRAKCGDLCPGLDGRATATLSGRPVTGECGRYHCPVSPALIPDVQREAPARNVDTM